MEINTSLYIAKLVRVIGVVVIIQVNSINFYVVRGIAKLRCAPGGSVMAFLYDPPLSYNLILLRQQCRFRAGREKDRDQEYWIFHLGSIEPLNLYPSTSNRTSDHYPNSINIKKIPDVSMGAYADHQEVSKVKSSGTGLTPS